MNPFLSYRRTRKGPELSIAPLIDCIFLLLIFFMVTTTFTKETGVKINKPSAAKSDVLLEQNMLIAVTKEGEFWIEKQKYDIEGVRFKVDERLAEYPETTIVVMADKESLTGSVVDVLDECKQAGAAKLSIATKVESLEELEP